MDLTKPLVDDPPAGIATEFLAPKKFGQLAGLSQATVRRRIKDGTLPFVQLGGRHHRILIRSDALEQLQSCAENIAGSGDSLTRSNRLPGRRPKWQTQN
jgi:excisionase family DNA binding protein